MTGNPDNLRRAAARKRAAATDRANLGLRQLVKDGRPITFATVAAEAGVSRDFLYRNTELRDRIEQLRTQQAHPAATHHPAQAGQAADVSSVIRTLTLKLAHERARHRRELADLRAALAAAHGELLLLRRQQGGTAG